MGNLNLVPILVLKTCSNTLNIVENRQGPRHLPELSAQMSGSWESTAVARVEDICAI